MNFEAVLDGELIVMAGGDIAPLQSTCSSGSTARPPDPKLIAAYPGHIIPYDALSIEGRDLRPLPLTRAQGGTRALVRSRAAGWRRACAAVAFRNPGELQALRAEAATPASPHIEGLMLKRLDSPYVAAAKGPWYNGNAIRSSSTPC